MKILLLGSAGQLGSHLRDLLSASHKVIPLSRSDIDLSNTDQVADTLEPLLPDLVINAAAYTAVDRAESEPELAARVNAESPGIIAGLCSSNGVPFIHYSTDYVFDGKGDRPYLENDDASPAGVYGETKLAGERAVLAQNKTALVLRTSWVYSYRGSNFYKTMLRLANEREEINVVADQFGAPTYTGSIVTATERLVEIARDQGAFTPDQAGVFHMTCSGQTSWCEFARTLLAGNGIPGVRVNAISTEEYPTPAARPAYSVLDNTRLQEVFNIKLPDWEVALQHCISDARHL